MYELYQQKTTEQKMVIRNVINQHAYKWMMMFQSHHSEGNTLIKTLMKRLKDESTAFAHACNAVADNAAISRIINSTIYRWVINPMQVRVEAEEELRVGSHVVLIVQGGGEAAGVYMVPIDKVVEQFGSMEPFLQLNQVPLQAADSVMYPGRDKMMHILSRDTWGRYLHNTQGIAGVFVSRVVVVTL